MNDKPENTELVPMDTEPSMASILQMSEIEADHKPMPVLLRQYLKLNGRLLGFNVDPDFSDVLDVLIMVDLRHTDRKILSRTMGRDGVARFLEAHQSGSHSRAG